MLCRAAQAHVRSTLGGMIPIITGLFWVGLCKGISPQNMAWKMVLTYLHQLDPEIPIEIIQSLGFHVLLLICRSDRASWKPNMRPMPPSSWLATLQCLSVAKMASGQKGMQVPCEKHGICAQQRTAGKHDAKASAEIWNGTYLNNVVNPTIGLPFGDDVYHPSMVILGVVYKWVTKHYTAFSTLPTVSTIIMFQYSLVIQEYWQEYRTKPWKISHWCWVTMATLDSQRLRGPLFSPGSVIAEELLNHRQ